MPFIPEIEKADLSTQQSFQLKKLNETLDYLNQNSPFYKQLFAKNNLNFNGLKNLSELKQIPITHKSDLQQYNWDFLCVPKQQIAEITATSGTLGHPVFIALTQNDLERLAYNEYLSLQHMAANNHDSVQLMLTLDRQFMAGMAYYKGLNKAGITAIRTGPALPEMQLAIIQQLNPTILVAVPSFLLKLIDFAKQKNIDLSQTSVRKVLAIGESLRTEQLMPNQLSKRIKENWNLDLFSTYAATEMQTAFTECHHFVGGHLHPELLITEILDANGNHTPNGTPGEVTITTLGIEGMPLLRYATGDIAIAYTEPCACGRNTMRLGSVLGRKQQMIKFKGTTIFPNSIFEVLQGFNFIQDYVLELNIGSNEQDNVTLYLAVSEKEAYCIEILKPVFQHKWRVVPNLKFVSNAEIQTMQYANNSRKPKKIVDLRS